MKKLTGTSLILALAMFFGAQSTMAGSLDDQDMAFAFDSESSMDMVMLSEQEMVETEGEFFIVGAILGFIGYAVYNTVADVPWDAGDAVSWSAAGAIGGVGGFAAQTIARGAVSSVIAPPAASSLGAGLGYGVSERIQNGSNNFGRDIGSYCPQCN